MPVNLTRRDFLRLAAAFALAPAGCLRRAGSGVWVNDVHSRLNPTRLHELVVPRTEDDVIATVTAAGRQRLPLSISGARHAMGGQQFAAGSLGLDMRALNRVLSFDKNSGLIEAEAGIQWPRLISAYLEMQQDGLPRWGIAQKQTGADELTLGGSLSANIHGRGLTMKPFIGDIAAFTIIDANGNRIRCSRQENPELFRLVIGGYGLFGVVTRVALRLAPRRKLRRLVEIIRCDELIPALEQRIREGSLYGDFQFSIDESSPDFLKLGVLSCYETIENDTPVSAERKLSSKDWLRLLNLAHTDRAEVFRQYAKHYLSTHGQTYWSDTHQLGPYLPDYAARLKLPQDAPSSLIITEIYVRRSDLPAFMAEAAEVLRLSKVPVIYGTVRVIEKDTESFLPWARENYACIIFNLLALHTRLGLDKAAQAFRSLIDLAAIRHGSYYLTYHKFATRQQVESCHPNFSKFLTMKLHYDPQELFQSDWYRHYRSLFNSV